MSKQFQGKKNKLIDLNDHLFAQLERLQDDELNQETEIKKAEAMVSISEQILKTHIVEQKTKEIHIQAAKIAYDMGVAPSEVLGVEYEKK